MNEIKYNVNFYDADIQTIEFDDVLDNHCQDTDYIILGFKDDGLSIETALFLRRYFLYTDTENYSNAPQINIWLNYEIKELDKRGISEKNYLIGKEQNVKMYFQIDSFGTREQVYHILAFVG